MRPRMPLAVCFSLAWCLGAKEALAVRGRALAGRAAGGAGEHWPREAGKGRLEEVVGRMRMPGEAQAELVARWLSE